MKKITIIVPLHEYNEKYLIRALSSFKFGDTKNKNYKYYEVLFVGPKDICKESENIVKNIYGNLETRTLVNEELDFATQINKAVFDCVTPYFTILEYDDMYTYNYFKNVQEVIKKHPEYSVILPINEFINTDEEMVCFGNEIALDPSFVDEIGIIGLDELQLFMDFNCTGGLFKTEDFISLGGLKKSLKIAAWYEFLLRVVYKSKKIHVMPKIGYLHTINREGSYMNQMKKTITQEEGKFLIDTARQEYFFKEDRNIIYKAEEKTEE
jgi:hypothetical protein